MAPHPSSGRFWFPPEQSPRTYGCWWRDTYSFQHKAEKDSPLTLSGTLAAAEETQQKVHLLVSLEVHVHDVYGPRSPCSHVKVDLGSWGLTCHGEQRAPASPAPGPASSPHPRQGTYGQGQEFFPNQVLQAFSAFFLSAQTCPSADSPCHTRASSACPGDIWGSNSQGHRVRILQPGGVSLTWPFRLLFVQDPEHRPVRGGPLLLIPT